MRHADTHSFGGCVDRAGDDRGAGRQPRCLRCGFRHVAGDLGGPQQVWHCIQRNDAGRERVVPGVRVGAIERGGAASRVVIDGEFSGQPVHQERCGIEELAGSGKDLRAMALEPENLGADRLGGEGVAAALDDRLVAGGASHLANFRRGAGVDAVENRIHERCAIGIHRQHAGANAAGADACNRGRRDAAFGKHAPCHVNKIAPPVGLGVVLGPARLRHLHAVRPRRRCNDFAGGAHDNALGFESADVNAKVIHSG